MNGERDKRGSILRARDTKKKSSRNKSVSKRSLFIPLSVIVQEGEGESV